VLVGDLVVNGHHARDRLRHLYRDERRTPLGYRPTEGHDAGGGLDPYRPVVDGQDPMQHALDDVPPDVLVRPQVHPQQVAAGDDADELTEVAEDGQPPHAPGIH
jgi:hypothetical protein